MIDNPRDQVQPPHTHIDREFSGDRDRFLFNGITRDGSLSSEREIRLREGATVRVLNVHQFLHEDDGFTPTADFPETVSINHTDPNQSYTTTSHGKVIRSSSKGSGTGKTTIKRPNDAKS